MLRARLNLSGLATNIYARFFSYILRLFLVLQKKLHVFLSPISPYLKRNTTRTFMVVKTTRILPGLVIYSFLKDDEFIATKKDAAF